MTQQTFPPPQGQPYPGPQPGQPAFGAPVPPKKPFYKKKWFLVLAAVVLVVIIASAVNGGGSSGTSARDDAASAPAAGGGEKAAAPAKSAIGIGQPARDGKFEFVVKGVDCSKTELGDQYMSKKAQGQFCIIDLTVKNIGDKPQSFFGDNAKLFNAQGQQFSADSEAAIYLPNSSSLYEEVNPGNTLTSKVVFDVPAGMKPAQVELHDSALSGGVKVGLQ